MCQSGVRSAIAHRVLTQAGFDSASLSGGMLTLRAALGDHAGEVLVTEPSRASPRRSADPARRQPKKSRRRNPQGEIMCYAVTCKKCGKTTWAGGQHVDQVMRGILDQSAAKGTRKNPAPGSSRACSPADHPIRKDHDMTTGDPDAQRKILHRLRRARGQLDAVISAVEQDKPCRDVVTSSRPCRAPSTGPASPSSRRR
jgi:hypothetical protein